MFEKDDVIDGKYRVDGICSDTGGMGSILFVAPLKTRYEYDVVLKFCREKDEECLKRFCREVRLLGTYKGNSKVIQIVDRNLDHDPPYFVMKYYKDGDLVKNAEHLRADNAVFEQSLIQMIDCLQELHSRNEFHRDIKPQNFLLDGDKIVVSDFGLTTEIGSGTAFTRSSTYWGTHGYIPPEFLAGGFKHADAPSDIFMLGKTFYVILTGRDPMYPSAEDIPSPLFHVIERCCSINKTQRYQTLSELKQSLVAAFDVLLDRAGGIGKTKQLLSAINDQLEQTNNYDPAIVSEFVEQLALLGDKDQIRICFELKNNFYSIIGQEALKDRLPEFLQIYEKVVESQNYSWSYAEVIADRMRLIFDQSEVPLPQRAFALDLAIRAAHYMSRFAAMDTCKAMIAGVADEALGLHVATVILKRAKTFAGHMEASECQSGAIRNALDQAKANESKSK